MNERRFESRFLCADLVQLEWLEHTPSGELARSAGCTRPFLCGCQAVLEDISQHGACVQVDAPIPLGAAILLSSGCEHPARLAGITTYCVFRDYGYFIGIRFSEETLWAKHLLRPQHLTSLEALARQGGDP